WQLETMDGRGAQFARIGARTGDDQIAVLDHRLGAVAVDAGQRDQHQNLPIGLQNIDRRLPGDLARLRRAGPEYLTMHALGAREHLARFRPHPIARYVASHFAPSSFGGDMCGRRGANSTPAPARPSRAPAISVAFGLGRRPERTSRARPGFERTAYIGWDGMKKLAIGDVTITSIIERDGPWRRPEEMFPAYDAAVGKRHLAELDSEVFDPASGRMIITYQTYVVRTPKHTILIDTCTGEDKGYPPPMDFPKQP